MALKEDLEVAVKKIFHDSWDSRVGRIVPVPEDLGLGNDAVKLDATVLYADIADSTKLVDASDPHFAAEVYRTYLTCAARIVRPVTGSSPLTMVTGSWACSSVIRRTRMR